MPDTSLLKPYNATCGGGLVLNKDVYDMAPGEALQLVNFEPSTEGGYRRLNGTTKYNSTIVPQVSASTERVQMSAIFNDKIIAARGGTVVYGDTSGSWTSLATSKGTTHTYDFDKFNFNGTSKILIATGEAAAFTVDSSFNVDVINATGGGTAPTNPKFVKTFANHVFYGGMSNSTHSILFSVPFQEDNFTSASGAGEVKVGDIVTGLKVFRDELLGGDLIFLAADGLRTVAGTERIGDVELGTISKQVQERINEIEYDNVTATVVRNKSQYRLFYPKTTGVEASSKGLLAVIKTNPNTGQLGFEYADIKGLKVSSCDSDYISNIETIVHGGYDGYVYKQESGNVFTTASTTVAIDATYRSPDMTMGDAGIRKSMDRVNINWEPEGIVSSSLFVRYNYDDINTPQPSVITLASSGSGAYYGIGTFGTAAYGQGDLPITRESVEGSGFAVALKITDTSTNAPFAIKGFQLEFTPGGRR